MGELPLARKMGQRDRMTQADAPPFSHMLDRPSLDRPTSLSLSVEAPACAAIAAAFGLIDIAALTGRFEFNPHKAGQILTRLDLSARVTHRCIVTLEPVEQMIEERAALILADASLPEPDDWLDLDAPDWVPVSGAEIDVGKLLTDQLALALDPYPRKADATLPDAAQEAPENPFARLKRD